MARDFDFGYLTINDDRSRIVCTHRYKFDCLYIGPRPTLVSSNSWRAVLRRCMGPRLHAACRRFVSSSTGSLITPNAWAREAGRQAGRQAFSFLIPDFGRLLLTMAASELSEIGFDSLFTIGYLCFCACVVVPPTEIASAGFTVQNLFAQWLGSEDMHFIYFHIRRSAATLMIHSLLPLGNVLHVCWKVVMYLLHKN